MPDTASGAQAVQPAPESSQSPPLPTSPIAQSEIAMPGLPQSNLLPMVDSVQPPQESQSPSVNEQVVDTSSVQTEEASHPGALFPITPPSPEAPRVAPEVEPPKQEVQPTVAIAESLPTGTNALLQRATLDTPSTQALPGEESTTQPIEPEVPQVTNVAPAPTYEPLTPQESGVPESHGSAPETTGASMQPLASPEEIAQLTAATSSPEEKVVVQLPIQPEASELATTAVPLMPTIPEATPSPKVKIDFEQVLQSQRAALLETPEALAEQPNQTKISDEEVSIEQVSSLKRSDRLETASDEQLESHIGSGITQ